MYARDGEFIRNPFRCLGFVTFMRAERRIEKRQELHHSCFWKEPKSAWQYKTRAAQYFASLFSMFYQTFYKWHHQLTCVTCHVITAERPGEELAKWKHPRHPNKARTPRRQSSLQYLHFTLLTPNAQFPTNSTRKAYNMLLLEADDETVTAECTNLNYEELNNLYSLPNIRPNTSSMRWAVQNTRDKKCKVSTSRFLATDFNTGTITVS
jgi:hypothetical protein